MIPNLEKKHNNNLQNIISKYKKSFGGKKMNNEYLLTGNKSLDSFLKGGYKKGALTEISGVTDSGKTLLALQAIKELQKEGQNKLAIYIDTDYGLTNGMLEDNDIDQDGVIVLSSNYADSIGPVLSNIVKSHQEDIGIIILDDLAKLTTTKEQAKPLIANTDIHRTTVVKGLLMRLANLVRNTDICCLIINQERGNFTDENNSNETVSSFEKWVNICCSTRLRLSIDEDGDSCVEVTFKEMKI